jgi:pyruvate kinase
MKKLETKIICTIGPASLNPEVFSKMAGEGMAVARINFSHGSAASRCKIINMIDDFNAGRKRKVLILQDLEGFRIRVSSAGEGGEIEVEKGKIYLWGRKKSKKRNYIRFDYEGPFEQIKTGSSIYVDDGMICFKVLFACEDYIKTEAVIPGLLKENKGVNIPEAKIIYKGMKYKDKRDIEFGLGRGVNFIAQSFVRKASDIIDIRKITLDSGSRLPLIAKIENREGISNIDEIIDVSDGIMIARGDMGVTMPVYEIPVIQKRIIKKCRLAGKFAITATQMLESMTHYARPTRAEVSDIANAVLDGSDFVMLSGETAVGKYPVDAVRTMRKTIEYTLENSEEIASGGD